MKEQVYWHLLEPRLDEPRRYDFDRYTRRLAEISEELGLPFIDLTEPLRAHARNGRQLYFPVDCHWNADGNELVAAILREALTERGLIPADGPSSDAVRAALR